MNAVNLLEEVRKKSGLTNNKFADFLGVRRTTYYAWKSGKGEITEFTTHALEAYDLLNVADLKWLVKQRGL